MTLRLNDIFSKIFGLQELEFTLANCKSFVSEAISFFLKELIIEEELHLSFEKRILRGVVFESGVGFPHTCFEIYIGRNALNISINISLLEASKKIKYQTEKDTDQVIFSLTEKETSYAQILLKDIKKAYIKFSDQFSNTLDINREAWEIADFFRGIWEEHDAFAVVLSVIAYVKKLKKSGTTEVPELRIEQFYGFVDQLVHGIVPSRVASNYNSQQFHVVRLTFERIFERKINLSKLACALTKNYEKSSDWAILPEFLCDIIPKLLAPQSYERIYSSMYGIGSLERAIIQYTYERDSSYPVIDAYEINSDSVYISILLNYINDIPEIHIANGDTFRYNTNSERYSLAICTPPFGVRVRVESYPELYNEMFARFVSRRNLISLEEFSLLKAYFSLNSKGRMAIVVSSSFFFRKDMQETIRFLLEYDHIELIIDLPGRLYSSTAIPTKLVIINKNKSNHKRNKIAYVSAEKFINAPDLMVGILNSNTKDDSLKTIEVDKLLEQEVCSINQYFNIQKHLHDGFTSIGNVVKIKAGQNFKHTDFIKYRREMHEDLSKGKLVRVVRPSDITENRIDFSLDMSDCVNCIERKSSTRIIREQCILVTNVGSNLKPVVYTPENADDCIAINQNLFALIPTDSIDINYLCMLLMTDKDILSQISSLRHGAAAPRITISAMKQIYIKNIKSRAQQEAVKRYKARLLEEEHIRHNLLIDKLQEEKAASDYEIAGAMAHNINNKIMPLKTSIDIIGKYLNDKNLLTDLPQEPIDKDDIVETLENHIKRCSSMCESISKLVKDAKSVLIEKIKEENFCEIDLFSICQEIMESHSSADFKFTVIGNKALVRLHKQSFIEAIECMLSNAKNHAWNVDGMTPEDKIFKLIIDLNPNDESVALICRNSGKPFPKDYSMTDYLKIMNKSSNSSGSGIGGAWIAKFMKAHNASFSINRLENTSIQRSGTEFTFTFNLIVD